MLILPRMTVYVRFCSCQLTAAAVLQKLTEESEDFRGLVRRCQTDPRTKGMPLSSFLIKPMQRITKYPLLIQKILEFTPPEHPDHAYLLEALAKAEEFCIQVNEGVREKENSDRLEWLQSHVSCEGLDERIVFNSLTNSVGPRKFLHYGSLTKTKSGKELVGFLLNDFLLLAQPCRPLSQPFSFERHSHVRFKIYKQPLMLSEVVVHTGSETAESVELRLEHMRAMFSLSAASSSDRNLWLRKIQQAQDEVTHSDKCKLQRQQSKQQRFGAVGRVLVVVVEGSRLKAPSPSHVAIGYCLDYCLPVHRLRSTEHKPSYIGAKMWNCLPEMLKKVDQQQFARHLKTWLLNRPFYSIEEFMSWQTQPDF
ncbi:Intersectin 1 (SH3 domain protein) [Homalodisca vitripennis]|nr:Intersectin 1 (SH3 domain protein) [Homalodisca vitripennis]